MHDIERLLRPPASGVTLVITVGNPYRTDDGVGPYIAGGVTLPKRHIVILNADARPENIIDAAIVNPPEKNDYYRRRRFQRKAGRSASHTRGSRAGCYTQHTQFTFEYRYQDYRRRYRMGDFFLGVQYKSMDFGEALSPDVLDTAGEIIELLSDNVGLD